MPQPPTPVLPPRQTSSERGAAVTGIISYFTHPSTNIPLSPFPPFPLPPLTPPNELM
ncbi:hypothetical protein M011DRAFT_469366, partial [Sporormia fimetaria CBS 119925]